METILLIVNTEPDGSLAKAALESLTAAKSLAEAFEGSSLRIGLVGQDVAAAADSIAGCGAAKFLGVSGPEFAPSRYASDAAAAEALARAAQATILLTPATSRWSRALPGVAHRLEGRLDTQVTELLTDGGTLRIARWYYRQRMKAILERTQRPWLITLAPGSFPPWQGEAGNASVEAIPVELPESGKRTTVTGIQAPPADEQTIRPDAELLFVAGAGWTKNQKDGQSHVKEAEQLILGFLHHTQASLGGSKSLVDLSGEGQQVLSFMTHLNQVGQTGSTPRHPKGLATCCHGEEPHVVGWRFVNERRAVNLDPNCGWAQGKADVLYVADAFEVVRKVNKLLGV